MRECAPTPSATPRFRTNNEYSVLLTSKISTASNRERTANSVFRHH
jgi:hypothetical protein